jgi:hypothetical protein
VEEIKKKPETVEEIRRMALKLAADGDDDEVSDDDCYQGCLLTDSEEEPEES